MSDLLTPAQVVKKKKRIINPSGSVSTERSITVQTDRGFINIPTIVGGKQLTSQQAIESSKKDKIKRKFFKTKQEAIGAAKVRSEAIGQEIFKQKLQKLRLKKDR